MYLFVVLAELYYVLFCLILCIILCNFSCFNLYNVYYFDKTYETFLMAFVNQFPANVPLLYSLKTYVFWCVQGVEKWNIGWKWVKCRSLKVLYWVNCSRQINVHTKGVTVLLVDANNTWKYLMLLFNLKTLLLIIKVIHSINMSCLWF